MSSVRTRKSWLAVVLSYVASIGILQALYAFQGSEVLCDHLGAWERYTSHAEFALLMAAVGLGIMVAAACGRLFWVALVAFPLFIVPLNLRIAESLHSDLRCAD